MPGSVDAIELRRHFPGITDNVKAVKAREQERRWPRRKGGGFITPG